VYVQNRVYVAQDGLEFIIILPHPPEYWDYRHEIPHAAQNYFLKYSFKNHSGNV
jgi:hypothetical protein